METDPAIDSGAPFKLYVKAWHLLGLREDGTKVLYGAIDAFITVLVTFWYPVHLLIGLTYAKSQKEFFRGILMNVISVTTSLKQIDYKRKLRKMKTVFDQMAQLDERIQRSDERAEFRKDMKIAENILTGFFYVYTSVLIFSLLSLVTASEWRLVYPAWMPFDWRASLPKYITANFYQYVGSVIEVLQGYATDFYGPIAFCMLSGHIRQLRMRVSKVGHEAGSSATTHYNELVACMRDFNDLMSIFDQLQQVVSSMMFIQIASNALNVGFSVIYITLYADSIFTYAYHVVQLFAMLCQLFPCCYFGSVVEVEFQDLPYDICSANWLEQPRQFRKGILNFAVLASRRITAKAGLMFELNLKSFFGTCKMAYSMFTFIQTMKGGNEI